MQQCSLKRAKLNQELSGPYLLNFTKILIKLSKYAYPPKILDLMQNLDKGLQVTVEKIFSYHWSKALLSAYQTVLSQKDSKNPLVTLACTRRIMKIP